MAEVSEVHVRVNGWCDACGGIGRQAVEHEDRRHPNVVSDVSEVVGWLAADLRRSAAIMEPVSAGAYRRLADHIERFSAPVAEDDVHAMALSLLDYLQLTAGERRFLAMHAQYESNRQDDWRYQHKDPVERARLKARWQQIADTFHNDPWGTRS